jgi:hypothetical protein
MESIAQILPAILTHCNICIIGVLTHHFLIQTIEYHSKLLIHFDCRETAATAC